MLKIFKQQMNKRWDILPVSLREILSSPEYGKIIWRACEAQHLSEDKIKKILGLSGCVIYGFIHPEELPKEIKENLSINIEIANEISREIDRKIFMPIRSEIDKVYTPAAPISENEDIVDLRKKPEEKFTETPKQTEAQSEVLAQKPTQKPEEKIEEKKEIPIPTPAATPEAPKETPKILSTEEKESPAIEINKIESKRSSATKEAEPFIIHKQEEARPILSQKRSLGGLFSFLSRKDKKEESGPVKAEIEIAYTIPMPPKAKAEPAIASKTKEEKQAIDLQKLNEEKQKILNAQFQAQAPAPKQFPQETIKTNAPIVIRLDEQKNQPIAKPSAAPQWPIKNEPIENKPIENKPRIVNYSNLTTPVSKVEISKTEAEEQKTQKPNEQIARKELHEIEEKELTAVFQQKEFPRENQRENQKEFQREFSPQIPKKESPIPPIPPMPQAPRPQSSASSFDSLKYETPKIEIIVPEQKSEKNIEPRQEFKKESQPSDLSQSISAFSQKSDKPNLGEISKIEIKTPSIEIKTEKNESENDDVVDLRTFERKKI